MTTIVYADGVLASDSQATSGWSTILSTPVKKIYTPEEGKRWSIYNKRILAVGYAGDAASIYEIIEAMEKGIMFDTKGKWDEWGTFLAVADDRTVFLCESKGDRKNTTFFNLPANAKLAIGSGGDVAHAYLSIGKKPADVIKLVSKIDNGTGGDVQIWEFPEVLPEDIKPVEKTKDQQDLINKVEADLNAIRDEALAKATEEILKRTAEPKAEKATA